MDRQNELEKNTEEIEEKKPPLNVTITAARADMQMAIIDIEQRYKLPAYLTDLIVSACLSDIRDCVTKELIN
jgi:hypothetical protein|nr:MAG TPA: hypothetical protein [Bacteriophage sp.]